MGTTQPTGVGRRRTRLSDAETRSRMLTAGRNLIEQLGMSVSLEHLGMEEIIAAAGVSRSSVYRRWPHKDQYLADLLVSIAESVTPHGETAGIVRQIMATVAAEVAALRREPLTQSGARQAMHEVLVEGLRVSGQEEFDAMRTSPAWRTYLALSATLAGLPAGEVRDRVTGGIADSDARFVAHRELVSRAMIDLAGYRLRAGVDPDLGYHLLATASGAVMTGLILRSATDDAFVTRRFEAAPFGSHRVATWSEPGYILAGTLLSHIEPDPDVVWTQAEIDTRQNRLAAHIRQWFPEQP